MGAPHSKSKDTAPLSIFMKPGHTPVTVKDPVGMTNSRDLAEHLPGGQGSLPQQGLVSLHLKGTHGDPWVAQRFGACLWPRA